MKKNIVLNNMGDCYYNVAFCSGNFPKTEFDEFFDELFNIYSIFEFPTPAVTHIESELEPILVHLLSIGLKCIIDGCYPEYTKIVLDFEMYKFMQEGDKPNNILTMKVLIIKDIITIIRDRNLKSFGILVSMFCSFEFRTELNSRLGTTIC